MLVMLEPVQKSECDPHLTVWHNLKTADIHHHFPVFNAAALGWFRLYPNCNFQDLETELRKKNLQTHLIATPFTKHDKEIYSLTYPLKTKEEREKEGIPPMYKVTFSCRPVEYALKELLKYSTSYGENFQKLKITGYLIVKNMDIFPINDNDNRKLDPQDEILPLTKITLNQCLVHFKKIT